MFSRLIAGLVVSFLAVFPTSAHAAPILWTLDLNPALGVTGSFVFDADTVTYSNVNITVTSPAVTFDSSEVTIWSDANSLELQDDLGGDLTDDLLLVLSWGAPGLTNAGGTVPVRQISFNTCSDATCSGSSGFGSIAENGNAVASAVPEPASLLLVGSGLLGAGVRRWRKKRS
jgi:hypothetical protein